MGLPLLPLPEAACMLMDAFGIEGMLRGKLNLKIYAINLDKMRATVDLGYP